MKVFVFICNLTLWACFADCAQRFFWGTEMLNSQLLKRQHFYKTPLMYRKLTDDFEYRITDDLKHNLTAISHIEALNTLDSNAIADLLAGGPLHTFVYIHIENEIDKAYNFTISVYGW